MVIAGFRAWKNERLTSGEIELHNERETESVPLKDLLSGSF